MKKPAARATGVLAHDTERQAKYRPYRHNGNIGISWLRNAPTHWVPRRVKHVVQIRGGQVDPKESAFADLVLLAPNHIESQTGRIVEKLDSAFEQGAISGKYRFQKGDVLYSKIRPELAKACVAECEGLCSADMYAMVVRDGTDSRFLLYVLLSDAFTKLATDESMRVAMPKINREDLGVVRFPFPPLAEQRVIASFLDRETVKIDVLVEKKRRLIDLLKEKRIALISHAITKGLDPNVPMKESGVELLGKVPEHWTINRLRFVMRSIEQGWSPQCESRQAEADEWGVLKVGCVNGPNFDQAEQKAVPRDIAPVTRYEIRRGDVLMSRANTRELLGSAAFVEDVRPRLLLCDKLYRIRFDQHGLDSRFAVLAMRSASARFQFERECDGASGSMKNIGQDTIKNLWLPLPPLREQHQILERLAMESAKLDTLVGRIGEAIDRLLEYRTALISAAVTGKIDVRGEVKADG